MLPSIRKRLSEMATEETTPEELQHDGQSIIQGLWIGAELSVMEQLSIASFLQNGHEYHLYVYDETRNIPAGTIIKDAGEILPASNIFQYTQRPSYAGFANFFRYKLLLERGGWWADTDIVCLKPFDFSAAYVFSSEMSQGLEVVTSGVIKAPVGSQVMAYAWKVCHGKEPKNLTWGETGPRLMAEAVSRFLLEEYKQPWRRSMKQLTRFTCGTKCGGLPTRIRMGNITPIVFMNDSSGSI